MNTRIELGEERKTFQKVVERNILRWQFAGTGGMNMTGSILRAKSIVHVLHVVPRRIIMDMELQETTHIQTLQK